MPPSVVLWPAPLWPPLRTASSVPVARAKAMTRATSAASATRTMADGRWSAPPSATWRNAS